MVVRMTRHPNRQGGFSLIEVLVSVIVISLGLLGMSALQSRASKQASEAYIRSIALSHAEALAEKIRVSVADSLYQFDADANTPVFHISSSVACFVSSSVVSNADTVCGNTGQSNQNKSYLASQTADVSQQLSSGSISVRLWRNNTVVSAPISLSNCDYSFASGSSSTTPCALSVLVSWRESSDNPSSPMRNVEYFVR